MTATYNVSQSELYTIQTILTGLVITAGEVDDSAAFHVGDFVSLTGLNLRHDQLMEMKM